MFRRVVNVVEILAVIGAVAFVILLFANNPGGGAGSGSVGAQLFAANCASCHGADGSGGVGPQLSGGRALRDFPNEADQITFVANGRGIMPGFATALSPAQLKAVVGYTRTALAK
jgi:mono/diheme cytochrome c family protein